jgi:hypothetical protein
MAGDLGDDNPRAWDHRGGRGTEGGAVSHSRQGSYRGFATADHERAVVPTSSRDAADHRTLMERSGARVAFPTYAAWAVWSVVVRE